MSGRYFESSVMSIDQIQCSQYAYWIKIFDEYILLMLRVFQFQLIKVIYYEDLSFFFI